MDEWESGDAVLDLTAACKMLPADSEERVDVDETAQGGESLKMSLLGAVPT